MISKYMNDYLERIRRIGINQSIPELCHIVNQIIIHREEQENKWFYFTFVTGFSFGIIWMMFIHLLGG